MFNTLVKSIFLPFSSNITDFSFNKSVLPTNSSTVLTPSLAIYSLNSFAINSIKLITYSGLPLNLFLSSGFWVAIPTGQVSKLHTLIITHPIVTSGAVANPNSSAPRSAATRTSLPLINLPSVSSITLSLNPFIIRVWWVSASPSSHGSPAL